MIRTAQVQLEYQGYIDGPPVSTSQLYAQACSSDQVTCDAWRNVWIENAKANKARFGSFSDNSVGQLYGLFKNRPVIVAGSGPSLKFNAPLLKERGEMGLVSCLHNFHFMEDIGAGVDLYVSLDASGEITTEELSEGGSRSPEEYWALTKDKTLACFIGTSPKLLEKWQGRVLFYRCPIPDDQIERAFEEIEPFYTVVSCGGNVLGSCVYIARCFLGGCPIVFVGADFAFGYEVSEKTGQPKFHSWDSKYDQGVGVCVRMTDVFGNKVKTWPSYAAFKSFFDRTVVEHPCMWINATEGGIFGAYDGGNIKQLHQMTLKQVIDLYSFSKHFEGQCKQPHVVDRRLAW